MEENIIRLTEAQLIEAVENTIARQQTLNESKKYHFTEQELKEYTKFILDQNKN